MRLLIQRVSEASVKIDGVVVANIASGLLVLIGIEDEDSALDTEWLVQKMIQLRIFNDADNKMNLSLLDIQGELLIISQFTLSASTKKGNRPSFINAAKPEIAQALYNDFISHVRTRVHTKIGTGVFGADMKVSLVNDGPVTIFLDSKNKE